MKKLIAVFLILAMLLNSGLAVAETQPEEETRALTGKPWVNSMLMDNLPESAPAAVDDFYLSVNYDVLKAHQEEPYLYMHSHSGDQQEAVIGLIHDDSFTDPEMEQLRIFFRQASDAEEMEKKGTAAADRYVDMIRAASNLDELNAVLLSDDFPFSPYICSWVQPESLKGKNIVAFYPALSLSDDPLQDVDSYDRKALNPDDLEIMIMSSLNLADNAYASLIHLGIGEGQTGTTMVDLYNTEFGYVSLVGNIKVYQNMKYGGYAESIHMLTAEELDALSPSFPLTATLKKSGKDSSPVFCVVNPEWIKALNALWTEENFEKIKLLTEFKVLQECSRYIDQRIYNERKRTPVIGEGNGWNACNRPGTFSQLIAKLYAEKVLGSEVKAKLTAVAEGLIEQYRILFRETDWIGEKTRAATLEKLDNMALNILGPKDGYIDYSGLKLKTPEEGGTLLDNYLLLKAYRNDQENRMIGQPATADMAWRMLAPTSVNAFYDAQSNSINILPAFINGADWWEGISDMEILGAVGTVVAHEIGHGFDFLGSQLNAWGMAEPILEGDDSQDFLERVEKIVTYYDGIESLDGVPTVGSDLKIENAADLVGLKAAAMLAASWENADLKAFFEMFAKIYAMTIDPFSIIFVTDKDTHAMNYLRVNVNAQMVQQFADTYGVQEGDGMYVKPEDRLNIWGR